MNPFSVKTPETLDAKTIADLFIDVYSDFPRLKAKEHTFLHGARGTGKSMMLRYLEPQVQIAAHNVVAVSELEHYAIHIPIKSPEYALSELERLDGSPYWLLAEHFMLCNIVLRIVLSLKTIVSVNNICEDKLKKFKNEIHEIVDLTDLFNQDEDSNVFDKIYKIVNNEKNNAKRYLSKIAFLKDLQPYESTLFGYEDFFLPLIKTIRSLEFTPKGPVFLMIDDADNLSHRMQQVLNTWVSYRTTGDICLKISTQQRYKTWRTMQGVLIERAHDFSEIDISAVYTSKHSSHYFDRVKSIVERRLAINRNKTLDPLIFFPENDIQKTKLNDIKSRIEADWENGRGVSSRKSDDTTRYVVSEYMKELSKAKKKNKYSYAGFKSLVDISSGMVRYFLEPASRMFAEVMASGKKEDEITEIPANIQDDVIYKWSEEFLLEEFNHLKQDDSTEKNKVEKLRNLITGLGECFHRKLISDDTERRFLSFMVTENPPPVIQDVIDLGVEWGYFYIKTIARKEGAGRNVLYVLNRRIAPFFKLDPSGYAAHLSLTPSLLNSAIVEPHRFADLRLKASESEEIQPQFNFVDRQPVVASNEMGKDSQLTPQNIVGIGPMNRVVVPKADNKLITNLESKQRKSDSDELEE